MNSLLKCKKTRRFGVEIELNSLDGRLVRPKYDDIMPEGSYYLASLVQNVTQESVKVMDWEYNNNNDSWIVKPDMSCGIELCSPILKDGWGLDKLLKVVDAISTSKLTANNKCSFHVHVNIGDLVNYPNDWILSTQLLAIVCCWIKCEMVFLDAMPPNRKCNTYCPVIGMMDLFSHETKCDCNILNHLSEIKYYTLNLYHMRQGRRPTIEFRIAGNQACKDPNYVKNWIRLVLHFVEMTKNVHAPPLYDPKDPYAGLTWLNPDEVFELLGFYNPLDQELQDVCDWFVNNMKKHNTDCELPGIWSKNGRSVAIRQLKEVVIPKLKKL